jgi:hypothetical protein
VGGSRVRGWAVPTLQRTMSLSVLLLTITHISANWEGSKGVNVRCRGYGWRW